MSKVVAKVGLKILGFATLFGNEAKDELALGTSTTKTNRGGSECASKQVSKRECADGNGENEGDRVNFDLRRIIAYITSWGPHPFTFCPRQDKSRAGCVPGIDRPEVDFLGGMMAQLDEWGD